MNINPNSSAYAAKARSWMGATLMLLPLAAGGYNPSLVQQMTSSIQPVVAVMPAYETTLKKTPGPTPTATASTGGESMDVSGNIEAQEAFERGIEFFNTGMVRNADPMFGEQLSYSYFEKATESFREAVQLDSEFAAGWYYLAASAGMAGEGFEPVIDALNHALEIKPDYAEAWFLRATNYYQLGNNAEGQASLEQALVANPDHFEALFLKGMASQNVQNWREALGYYTHAKEAMNDKVRPIQAFTLLQHRGYVLYVMNKYQEAIVDLEAAAKINSMDDFSRTVLANAYLALGNMKKCVEAFNQALTLNPVLATSIKENRAIFSDYQQTLKKGSEDYKQVEELLQKIDNS